MTRLIQYLPLPFMAAFLCLSFTSSYDIPNDTPRFDIAPDTSYLYVKTRIQSGENDAEENGLNGAIYFNSSDLEFCYDRASTGNQVIGLRFTNLWIPPGVSVTKAYIQFTADESQNSPGTLIISGENVADSAPFEAMPYDISTRTRTVTSVLWKPDNWTAGESGPTQRTADISDIVEEIVGRPDWTGFGLDMTFIIEGDGKRIAKSYDLNPESAPMLYFEYDF